VPILFGGPQVVPPRPDAVRAQIDSEQTVKMREALLGEEIESEGDTRRVADSTCPLAQGAEMMIGIFAGRRLQQFRREPEHPLRLVSGHEIRYYRLEISQHLDLG
jgi:hypothetical protein